MHSKRQQDVVTMEVSVTENGVGRACWDVRPRREGGSSKGFRRSSERARDDLHNKFMKKSFVGVVVLKGKLGFETELTRFYWPSPPYGDRNWSHVRQNTRFEARVKNPRSPLLSCLTTMTDPTKPLPVAES